MNYYSYLEDYIKKLYNKINITVPNQINMYVIADRLNIGLYPIDGSSEAIQIEGRQYIFINRNLSAQEQWQDFCHELCHILWHSGNQFAMPPPFREYQEWKADSFALHACIPTFMLRDIRLPRDPQEVIWVIQDTFNVSYEFAKIRLEQRRQQIGANLFQLKLFQEVMQ
ncbi:ImmA/IrrE family metallo-endopeptidase [Sporosarcina sp. FA9]|uniref:ImmA/IrrE family metallo-endopeptidase n=1 Tax=Sporosarcina sp. FA9 TaxID=3413030 RepID=UPI003F6565C7